MNRPPVRDQTSLRNFMENRPCLVESERAFAYEKEDLVTLRPGRDHSFVDAFVERMLKVCHCRLLQVGGPDPFRILVGRADGEQFIFCSEVSILPLWSPKKLAFLTRFNQETAAKSTDTDIRYFSRERVNAFVTLIITIIILLLLVVPIWLLYHLTVTEVCGSKVDRR